MYRPFELKIIYFYRKKYNFVTRCYFPDYDTYMMMSENCPKLQDRLGQTEDRATKKSK